ncbi:MAG: ABC transporter ATP-binding protein [Methanobacterium sp.]|nr:ABC transporter ATP-binding protein [Methanobacterium sp.]
MADDNLMIKMDSLNKSFGKIMALNNLNLDINRGELLGIIGPNGAGKTTAIRISCCILKPDSGDVLVDGMSIHKDQIKIKSMIGYLPEEPNLYERFKARDLLRYFAELYGVPRDNINRRIDDLLELVGMSHRAEDRINTFSKGLRQRIGISRALIHDPEILIFDEPTMGLDPATSHNIREFIRELKGDKTIILCTHYMDEADSLCDRVAILNQGRILDMGTPQELKSKLHSDIILNLELEIADSSAGKIIESFSTVEEVNVSGSKYTISLKSKKDIKEIISSLEGNIVSINIKEPTLEDVFINSFKN